jgi:hypothetical protein
MLPTLVIPDGLETREAQLKQAFGGKYERVSLEECMFAGHKAKCWTYKNPQTKTMEWGFPDGDSYVIFQLSATEKEWADAEFNLQVTQLQPEEPFRLSANVRIHGQNADQRLVRTLELSEREQTFQIECPFEVSKIELDPENQVLLEIASDSEP